MVSFDLITGKENWRALHLEEMGYCPPTIIQRNKQQELVIWSGDGIDSLNPRDGASNWNIPWKLRFALSISTPRQYGDFLYFTSFYNGSNLLNLLVVVLPLAVDSTEAAAAAAAAARGVAAANLPIAPR